MGWTGGSGGGAATAKAAAAGAGGQAICTAAARGNSATGFAAGNVWLKTVCPGKRGLLLRCAAGGAKAWRLGDGASERATAPPADAGEYKPLIRGV